MIVYSNVENEIIYSEEVDYDSISEVLRITENNNERITEEDQNRILE